MLDALNRLSRPVLIACSLPNDADILEHMMCPKSVCLTRYLERTCEEIGRGLIVTLSCYLEELSKFARNFIPG
jgi:hypothetical protein